MDAKIEKEIIRRYSELGYGLIKSGKPFGVSDYLVKKLLIKNGIKIRTFAEASKISDRNVISINHQYFNNENENMAYILGLLASDGTIRKNSNSIKLTLSEQDSEILEKIKKEINYSGTIKYYEDSKGYKNATLVFTSKEIKDKLAEYNIVPSKTFTFVFPTKLNRKYWKDFIRGYFDGDGSISSAGESAIRAQICSAQKQTLETMLNFLEQDFLIPKVNIQMQMRKQPLYYFQYSSYSTRKFFQAIYYENCMCLERKYKKFIELIPRNLK